MSDKLLLKLDLKTLIQQAEKNYACRGALSKLRSYSNMQDLLDNTGEKDKAHWCHWYARFVLKGAFPAGEECISKDTCSSYWYARDVLRGPFPAAEGVISECPSYSFWYARDVLKGPFEKGGIT